jgi:hypothetical protein
VCRSGGVIERWANPGLLLDPYFSTTAEGLIPMEGFVAAATLSLP